MAASGLTKRMGVGAEGERVDDLVFIDGACGFHVFDAVGVDAAACPHQQHPSSLGLPATHTRLAPADP